MIKIRLLNTFLFFFLFPFCLFSQTKFIGTVFCDDDMKTPLEGVNIKIYNHNGTILDKIKTDCDGTYTYQFLKMKPVKVVFSKRKYSSVTIDNLDLNQDCIYKFNIVFKKVLSLHDKDYDGTSIIASSKINCQ